MHFAASLEGGSLDAPRGTEMKLHELHARLLHRSTGSSANACVASALPAVGDKSSTQRFLLSHYQAHRSDIANSVRMLSPHRQPCPSVVGWPAALAQLAGSANLSESSRERWPWLLLFKGRPADSGVGRS